MSRNVEKMAALSAVGDPDSNSPIEARVAVLEEVAVSLQQLMEKMDRRMEKVEDRHREDIKWVVGLGIAGIGFLFATMGRGFHWF